MSTDGSDEEWLLSGPTLSYAIVGFWVSWPESDNLAMITRLIGLIRPSGLIAPLKVVA